MRLIAVILGILINPRCVLSSTGVIDISDPKSRELFSGPTKIGNAQFYKYTCKDNGSYSNVFDRNYQIFPLRSHTRLVNIVLACREENVELVQVMYCDVKKDLRLNNLYYKKSDDSWNLIDLAAYKSELFNLKNNYVSFQLNSEENPGFKKVKSEEEDGYNSYVLEDEYEIDKVYENKLVVWESDPNYTFKSLDLAKTETGQEQLRIQFSNYCSEVSQYYKISGGRWVMDIGKRVVDLRSLYTHGVERNEVSESDNYVDSKYDSVSPLLDENDQDDEFEDESVMILASDLCDVETGFGDIQFNMNFTKDEVHEFTVRYYTTYEISNYEFINLKGARVNSITDGDWYILNRQEDEHGFYNAKLSYVPGHDVATVALTSLRPMKESSAPLEKKCSNSPYGLKHFFHKKKGTVWFCLDQFPYYYEMNNLIEVASQLTLKRMYESPPHTPTHTPSAMYLDYGADVPFTYDINNPFENRLIQELIHTEPDFIRLKVKEGNIMNAIIDGSSVLWEQKEKGKGVQMIYVYKSETNLIAHILVDSKTEPHIFIKQYQGRWHLIDREEYESLKDVPMEPKKVGFLKKRTKEPMQVDEYSLDPYAKPQPASGETSDGESENQEAKEETLESSSEPEESSISHYDYDHGPSNSASTNNENNNNSANNQDMPTEFSSDDESDLPRRPVKIKKSSLKFSQSPRLVTIKLDDESEPEERVQIPRTFDFDEL